jgi:hypothetical protein
MDISGCIGVERRFCPTSGPTTNSNYPMNLWPGGAIRIMAAVFASGPATFLRGKHQLAEYAFAISLYASWKER